MPDSCVCKKKAGSANTPSWMKRNSMDFRRIIGAGAKVFSVNGWKYLWRLEVSWFRVRVRVRITSNHQRYFRPSKKDTSNHQSFFQPFTEKELRRRSCNYIPVYDNLRILVCIRIDMQNEPCDCIVFKAWTVHSNTKISCLLSLHLNFVFSTEIILRKVLVADGAEIRYQSSMIIDNGLMFKSVSESATTHYCMTLPSSLVVLKHIHLNLDKRDPG